MIVEGVLTNYHHTNKSGIARTDSGDIKLKFKGEYPYIQAGLKYKFSGEKAGKNLIVSNITPIDGNLSIKDGFLLFPMFTENDLKQIIEVTGIKTYGELLEIEKIEELLDTIDKDKAGKFMVTIYQLKKNIEVQEVWSLIKKTGIKLDITDAVYIVNFFRNRAKRNGTTVADLIADCPWLLLQTDIFDSLKDGIQVVEKMANSLSKSKGTANLLACATSVVARYVSKGNAYMPFYILYKTVSGYYPCDQETFLAAIGQKNQHIGYLITDMKSYADKMAKDPLYADKNKYKTQAVYLSRVFFEEKYIAKKINLMLLAKPDPLPETIPQYAYEWAKERGIQFNPAQKAVIDSVMNNKITVIKGGAGSGKTTVLRAIIYALQKAGIIAPLLAPTGIAAQRLAAESDIPFYTIHRYSHIYQDDDLFISPEEEEIEIQKDRVVIVDEMSMATIPVIAKLLSITGPETRLIFSGDEAQLPPIGPGGVFDALIRADSLVNVINLPSSYRQKGNTIENAIKIRNGEPIQENENVRIITASTWKKAVEETLMHIKCKNIKDIYILTQSRKGVDLLNKAIRQMILNTTESGFVEGDIVVTTRNDYDNSTKISNVFLRRIRQYRQKDRPTIYNGTRGIVKRVTDEFITVEFTLPSGEKLEADYSQTEVRWYIEHAFAMTVHKAQGGQASEVYFIEPEPQSLTRSMLYTAFTRSTGNITLIGGSKKEDWNDVKENEPQLSKLYWRLMEGNKVQANNAEQSDVLIEI